jgi:septum formation protein
MVILASASPRRRELLAALVQDFTVVPADIDESLSAPVRPADVAALALNKARAVAGRVGQGIVLGADTVVVVDGEPLGKPAGPEDARAMLRRLRGRGHDVITGIGAVDVVTKREAATAVVTRVFMLAVSDQRIDDYVRTGEPLDKAGGYAIQERGRDLIAGYVGSYTNVIGLPLDATRRLLRDFGV